MRKILFCVLALLMTTGTVTGQTYQSDNCIALDMAVRSKLFKNCFNFCLPERISQSFNIIDTGNYFKDFKYDTICRRALIISNQIVDKSYNTVNVYRSTITFRHFLFSFFCPATGVECNFIFEWDRDKKGVKKFKIIGTSSGSY